MTIGEILREYGAAIGPALAFLLGLAMLFIKDRVEKKQAERRSAKLLVILIRMFEQLQVPAYVGQITVDDPPDTDTDASANRANLSRFYKRLMPIRAFVQYNEEIITRTGSVATIAKFYAVKYHFELLLSKVDEARAKSVVASVDLDGIGMSLHAITETAANPNWNLDYSSRQSLSRL